MANFEINFEIMSDSSIQQYDYEDKASATERCTQKGIVTNITY